MTEHEPEKAVAFGVYAVSQMITRAASYSAIHQLRCYVQRTTCEVRKPGPFDDMFQWVKSSTETILETLNSAEKSLAECDGHDLDGWLTVQPEWLRRAIFGEVESWASRQFGVPFGMRM